MRPLFLYFFFLICLLSPLFARAEVLATRFQLEEQKEKSTFTLNLTGKAVYKVFLLTNPHRLAIDVQNGRWDVSPALAYRPKTSSALVWNMRHGIQDKRNFRIVLDLSRPVHIASTTLTPVAGTSNYQLVVGISSALPSPTIVPVSPAVKADTAKPAPTVKEPLHTLHVPPSGATAVKEPLHTLHVPPSVATVPVPVPVPVKIPVIVLDPGHGGDDPGTIGRFTGRYEKDIALDYARALKAALEKTGRYKVALTRKGDYFVPLGERVAIARKAQGDLFISLHINSHPKESMSGLSVYTVSDTASDKEAELLATEENKETSLKDINLSAENKEMAPVLINLMQRETKNVSAEFAEDSITELSKDVEMLRNTHRFAGFKVLKGADVPAVLFELGYLSNRNEENLLSSPVHEQKIVNAIVRAINAHFDRKI